MPLEYLRAAKAEQLARAPLDRDFARIPEFEYAAARLPDLDWLLRRTSSPRCGTGTRRTRRREG
ncbi:hypothetical protein [Streptomyces sp. NBC_00691]|uniref:hypothetical protein n=1 Tax=Streptomyces sp. NBC_00691 TaxID=2903671 RepID=UPI002E38125F|nr:hypothetical protein [Streptomyces sp. NBC_00691]